MIPEEEDQEDLAASMPPPSISLVKRESR